MAYLGSDLSEWPIVHAQFAPGATSSEDVAAFFSEQRLWLERQEPFAIILRVGDHLDAATRKLVAEKIRENANLSRRYVKAQAIVHSSMIVRGVLTAIHWLTPSPFPEKTFSSNESARDWVEERLIEANVHPPPRRKAVSGSTT